MKESTYTVEITRTTVATEQVQVKAASEREAIEKAEELAKDLEFNYDDAWYKYTAQVKDGRRKYRGFVLNVKDGKCTVYHPGLHLGGGFMLTSDGHRANEGERPVMYQSEALTAIKTYLKATKEW